MPEHVTYLDLCARVMDAKKVVDRTYAAVIEAKARLARIDDPLPLDRTHLAALDARIDAVKRGIIEARNDANSAATEAAACNQQIDQFRQWQADLVRTPRQVMERRLVV
jgi:DNA repair ATPase RecN